MGILVTIVFIALFLMGVPILFVFGLVSLFFVIASGNTSLLIMFPQRMFSGPDSFVILALPMFILAGKLMNSGGLSNKLIDLAKSMIGHVSGGLAQVNVAASMFFSGISGSALADSAAMGSVLIPAMVKEGYTMRFSAAITAISSCVGPIIPPSIAMIIYAAIANVSVASLFMAGVVPGLLLGVSLMAGSYIYTRIYKVQKSGRFSIRLLAQNLVTSGPALLFPIIILSGIFGGFFTPTEAAAVAVGYAVIIGFFVYRELTIKKLIEAIIETSVLTGAIIPILSTTFILSWLVGSQDVAFAVEDFLLTFSDNKIAFLLIINVILLFSGAILEPVSSIILLCPIFLPIVEKLGMSPIHFGVVMVLNLVLGFCTPPHGGVLFIVSSISNLSITEISKAVLPFLLIAIGVLMVVTFMPDLVMYLPNLLEQG